MYCPKCGKMLELDERDFCTGCGAKVDLALLEKARKKFAGKAGRANASFTPFGTRYVSSDTEITAMGKGLVIGAFLGFAMFSVLARFTFLVVEIAVAIGWGIIGIAPMALLGVFLASRLSPNSKAALADSFRFINTSGVVYHIIDFLTLKIPFLKRK